MHPHVLKSQKMITYSNSSSNYYMYVLLIVFHYCKKDIIVILEIAVFIQGASVDLAILHLGNHVIQDRFLGI